MTKSECTAIEQQNEDGTESLFSHNTVVDLFESSCTEFGPNMAYSNFGKTITYSELYQFSMDFAAYLQHRTNLKKGDKIAIQLPNLIQYPIGIFGALSAGFILVNTNPLYTVAEMHHQFKDSGARALIVLANMAAKAQKAVIGTKVEYIFITEIGDMLPPFKRCLVNLAVKYIKRMVPRYSLPRAIGFNQALKIGRTLEFSSVAIKPNDIALLQYTGGTTGVAKGAVLSHRNLIANTSQAYLGMMGHMNFGSEVLISPLPLYHILAFTVSSLVALKTGNLNVLITNPRDINSMIKEMSKWDFTMFVGLTTLFMGLLRNDRFARLNFNKLKVTIAGGMPLTSKVADDWQRVTGSTILEGYGLSESSPIVSMNPPGAIKIGTVGKPVKSTEIQFIDLDGNVIPPEKLGPEGGELCVKGPQVMSGYWQNEAETQNVFTSDGWLKTGDIGILDADGYIKIIDRKKDMILVSGFNVYPNELEDVLIRLNGVKECAAIGIPNPNTGQEEVVMFVVADRKDLGEEEVLQYCRNFLTAYKCPKRVIFRTELPKSNVGKILRRKLRDESLT